jgi:hypothetical protein
MAHGRRGQSVHGAGCVVRLECVRCPDRDPYMRDFSQPVEAFSDRIGALKKFSCPCKKFPIDNFKKL